MLGTLCIPGLCPSAPAPLSGATSSLASLQAAMAAANYTSLRPSALAPHSPHLPNLACSAQVKVCPPSVAAGGMSVQLEDRSVVV